MIDVIAAVLLVSGAAVTALGGLGLVRFPDVFTRMHAATKAATVGVIAMTAAAAAEAGAASGVLVLLLVVALLFLSGPLGMSLLARAAFRDAGTPRWEATGELRFESPGVESVGARRAEGSPRSLAVWLFVAWIAVFGSVRPHILLSGLAIALLLAFALRILAPSWPRALLRPVATARFVGFFSVELLSSTWDVSRMVLGRVDRLRPAIVEVPVRVATRAEIMVLVSAISFIPGTVALELHHGSLYVHVLSRKAPEAVVGDVLEMQTLIAAAFGAPQNTRSGNRAIKDV